jgi:tRNA-Thr(GGU) m(6)t(6)A37 methyltransferase TsaA
MSSAVRLRPVGIVRSPFKEPYDLPPPAFAPPRFLQSVKGTIEIFEEFAEAAEDLDGYSHLIVLFHFHRAGPPRLRSVPPGQTRARGIFSTRSPHRPNPLGMSVVKLLARKGRILEVAGLDMVDGTPVLDIKPYTRRDRKSHIRTGWLAPAAGGPEAPAKRSPGGSRYVRKTR